MFDPDFFKHVEPADIDPVKMVKGIIIYLVVGSIVWKLLHW